MAENTPSYFYSKNSRRKISNLDSAKPKTYWRVMLKGMLKLSLSSAKNGKASFRVADEKVDQERGHP